MVDEAEDGVLALESEIDLEVRWLECSCRRSTCSRIVVAVDGFCGDDGDDDEEEDIFGWLITNTQQWKYTLDDDD